MKKVILSCAAFAFFAATLVSCGENKDAATTETVSTEEVLPEETVPEASMASNDVPTFSDEEVNKGLADYKILMDEYIKAVEAKDVAKISELNTKAQEIAANAPSWGQKLKPEEVSAFSEYWQKLSSEWAAAAEKLTH